MVGAYAGADAIPRDRLAELDGANPDLGLRALAGGLALSFTAIGLWAPHAVHLM